MDKKVIFAVAGSGKTTYIINTLLKNKRSLIVTYTNGNHRNLVRKIVQRFCGTWPNNVTLMTYFEFLYRFCYKPFLSDKIKARGIIFKKNPNRYANQDEFKYYLSPSQYFYSNRLAFFLEKQGVVSDIRKRIETYFNEFIIDEVQDIAGRDFNFLEKLMESNINMLFVGDFYQHTYDTSRDGNTNKNLFDDSSSYEARFTRRGFICDHTTLVNSWRCGRAICEFVTENLGIKMSSNRGDEDNSQIRFISDSSEVAQILDSSNIIKLHYEDGAKYGIGHKNWGDTKGEDCYQDVCVMLNKATLSKYRTGKLKELPTITRNKLYVAITRAHGNCYLVEER